VKPVLKTPMTNIASDAVTLPLLLPTQKKNNAEREREREREGESLLYS
jgi:hypothetical protein